jgi:hypothetical protein
VMRSKWRQCELEKETYSKKRDIRRIRDDRSGASTPESAAQIVPRRSLTT